MEYDFSDEAIYKMVLDTHLPEEIYDRKFAGNNLLSITCRKCGDDWPCNPRKLLIAWHQKTVDDMTRFMPKVWKKDQ